MDEIKLQKARKELKSWIAFLKDCEEEGKDPCVVELYEDLEGILDLISQD